MPFPVEHPSASQFIQAPRSIFFEEIQAGDVVSRTHTTGGVLHTITFRVLAVKDGVLIDADGDKHVVMIGYFWTLIDRTPFPDFEHMRLRSAVVYTGLKWEESDSEEDAASLRAALREFRTYEISRTDV